VLDLSLPKILILIVLGLIIFGPEQLPKMASQAGRALRDLRRVAENAKNDLTDNLGPEFKDFDLTDLHPKNFVQKHLFDEPNGQESMTGSRGAGTATLLPGEAPPWDTDAT
jgi:sec-independent protein translocase protein TatB